MRLGSQQYCPETVRVAELLEDLEVGALLNAEALKLHFQLGAVSADVLIEVDRQTLTAALANLLQNAFKFTRPGSHVLLSTRVTADRVAFDVEDECGGLPPGRAEELFHRFEQRGEDRTGSGLGLSIALKGALANHGDLRVRDRPGRGCVFTLAVPRKVGAVRDPHTT